jgi:guanylate kinase
MPDITNYSARSSTQHLGHLFVVSAPSGAGKSSLIKALLATHSTDENPLKVSISHTTRGPRPGEVNGEHYHFVTHAEFESLIAQGAFFEHAKVFDHYYGTSRLAIENTLEQGVDVFLDIDWQGARQVKAQYPSAQLVFILPPSVAELEQRLIGRGQDSEEIIARRMRDAKAEMSHATEFDYLLINDDFAQTLGAFYAIVVDKRQTKAHQILRHDALLNALLK